MKKALLIPLLTLTTGMILCCRETEKKEVPADSEAGLAGTEVTYTADTTEMHGYLVYDQRMEGKRPGILVVHEWWGHNEYSRERAEMLAELGYTALAVDMYGDGKQAAHPDEAGKFSGMVMQHPEAAMARFDAAMEVLRTHETVDPDQMAAIGYCFGGSVVLTMANAGKDLDAVAAFHSGVMLPVMPGKDLKAKVLVCNGADDPFINAAEVESYKRAMDSVGADYSYISYEGARHSFTSKAADSLGQKFDLPLEYQEKADRESWIALQNLLNETFQ